MRSWQDSALKKELDSTLHRVLTSWSWFSSGKERADEESHQDKEGFDDKDLVQLVTDFREMHTSLRVSSMRSELGSRDSGLC